MIDDRVEAIDHQVCMLGGKRNKWSRWLATKGLLSSLRLTCDGQHQHLAWGVAKSLTAGWQFATAEEAEYPKILCQRVAQLVHDHVINQGALPVAGSISDPGLTDMQKRHLNRAATGKLPRGRTLPQLVSEFSTTTEQTHYSPSKSTKLLRQYFKAGKDGSQQLVYIVGHFREPAEFLKEVINCQHPIDIMHGIDDCTKRALFEMLASGPTALINKRKDFLERMASRAIELEKDEELLHQQMPEHVRLIMKGKKLLLLQEIFNSAGYDDDGIHSLLSEGTMLTGVTTSSGQLSRRIKPAEMTDTELRYQAQVQRDADKFGHKSSDLNEQVWIQAQEEVHTNWLSGPVSEAKLSEEYGTWIAHRRFGLKQGTKVRLIDDCRRGGINDCLCTTEKLDLMDVDRIVELLKEILRAEGTGNVVRITLADNTVLQGTCHTDWVKYDDFGIDFQGRLLDLKSAYKQMAVHKDSLWCSNVQVPSQDGRNTEYYKSFAVLFGSTASVYSFNRLGRGSWKSMTVHLGLLCTQFYDDFPIIEPTQTTASARESATSMLDILGIQWSAGDKDLPFASVFHPLGVTMDLSHMAGKAQIVISNKEARVESICLMLEEIKTNDSFPPPLASEVHGKLIHG